MQIRYMPVHLWILQAAFRSNGIDCKAKCLNNEAGAYGSTGEVYPALQVS